MIAEFNIENFFSIKSAQKISFEPSSDIFMSDEYSYEVKDGVRLLKVGIIYGANASGKTNILNAIEFFKMLVLRMPKDRTEKTGVVPFMLDDTSRNEKTKMSMVFYINQSKYILSFELDAKHIYSETLIVYDSIRPTKLYNRSYDTATDSSTIDFGVNLKMTKKSQDVISGNTINNCSVLAAFGKSNVERTRLNDVYDYFAKQVKDILAPSMLLSGYVKSRLDKDEAGDLKKFILNFLKASDANPEEGRLNEEQEIEQISTYLNFYRTNVCFLPKVIPEDIVYDEEYLKKICGAQLFPNLADARDSKEKLFRIANALSLPIGGIEQLLITQFIIKKGEDYQKISELLHMIAEQH